MKHYIDFHEDVAIDELPYLLDIAADMKAKTKAGIEHHYLKGKTLAMIFTKSSTRTRVSFEVGMYQLGGQALFLSNNDIQIGRGETIYDTAHVLSGMVDGIMIRTFKHSDVEDLAKYGSIPVINGLTDDQHPTQMLADLLTIKEHKGDLKGLKLCYVGDGNNVANSLLQACAKAGMDVAIGSPADYTCPDKYVKQAQKDAEKAAKEAAKAAKEQEAAERRARNDALREEAAERARKNDSIAGRIKNTAIQTATRQVTSSLTKGITNAISDLFGGKKK